MISKNHRRRHTENPFDLNYLKRNSHCSTPLLLSSCLFRQHARRDAAAVPHADWRRLLAVHSNCFRDAFGCQPHCSPTVCLSFGLPSGLRSGYDRPTDPGLFWVSRSLKSAMLLDRVWALLHAVLSAHQGFSTTDNTLGGSVGSAASCPPAGKYGTGPPASCDPPTDPNNLPKSQLEQWFTKEMFDDLFPFANLGWGGSPCFPYSYESFMIAARYFPDFGTSSPNKVYTAAENARRDLAAFFAHAVQETGENNAGLYDGKRSLEDAANCFYRGGFYNWFEGGPTSSFLDPKSPGYSPKDGEKCSAAGKYCASSAELDYWFPCGQSNSTDANFFTGCYFGRGAIQISYNYNYGQFQDWLKTQNITVNLLTDPNLVMTKMDPPLAVMASLWFYMTPQPPKPAMHDIVMGSWNAGEKNEAADYSGPIFGPTSLIINNECNGEDANEPGGPGESRRIKAFKWFCNYFQVPVEEARLLTCKYMTQKFDEMRYNLSYQPNWGTTWKNEPCECAPASYGGMIPYFDPAYYPEKFAAMNELNRLKCVASVYDNPTMYSMNNETSACLNY